VLGRLLTVAWITVVWLALWGDASWGNLVGGLAVGTFVLAALRLPATPRPRRIAARPALRYAVRFTRDLTVATAQVARQVLWPVHRLRPAVLAVPLRSGDPGLVSLVANSITLTPGTLTLEADDERRMLWVHVLHVPDEGADSVIEQAQALETLGARVLRVTLDPAGTAGGRP
jgi:multicomponent Na+:H+ antiporter subunit E